MSQSAPKRALRSEVPVEQTWNLKDLFESREAWHAKLKETVKDFEALNQYKGRSCESGKTLLKAMQDLEKAYEAMVLLGNYIMLLQAADRTNPESQEDGMAFGVAETQTMTQATFFDSELIALDDSAFQVLFEDEPGLEKYRLYLQDKYDKKKHMLSPETEEALAALGELTSAPFNIYMTSKATDMQFDSFKDEQGNEVPNSFAMFEGKYEFSPHPEVRKYAYASFTKTLEQYKNTYAAVYATEIRKQVAMSRIRGYKSVTEMLLEPQKVTQAMYENQLNIIFKELAPHMRRLAKLKQKQQGLETMHYWDLKAPIDAGVDPAATYDSIRETIIEALGVMGTEYQEIIKRAYDERWIDYCDNVGKSTGAFCAAPYGAHPYVLISYSDNMRSAFTLAHELGHAAHFVYTNSEQGIFDTEVSTYFVEAPSTINEMLLGQHLMKNSDSPEMKRWVILQLLGTYYHNFVTHMIEAEFQRRIYSMAEQDQALTAQSLCDTMLAVIREFWGDAVEIDEAAGMTWMRQPHYYMGLYPYTYSAGLTASTAVAQQIAEEGQPAVDRWLQVLKAGGSLTPDGLLKIVGVDMSTPAPINKVVAYVGDLITELEQLFA